MVLSRNSMGRFAQKHEHWLGFINGKPRWQGECGHPVANPKAKQCWTCINTVDDREYAETDLAYAAGIIDGEGCVSICRTGRSNGKYSYVPKVVVSMTDKEAIEWMASTLGGNMSSTKLRSGKTIYSWHLYGPKLLVVMPKLMPYLRVKKMQAELTIPIQKIRSRSIGQPYRNREFELFDLSYRLSKCMNSGIRSGRIS